MVSSEYPLVPVCIVLVGPDQQHTNSIQGSRGKQTAYEAHLGEHTTMFHKITVSVSYTYPPWNILKLTAKALKIGDPKTKVSFQSQHFLGAFAVSFREGKWISISTEPLLKWNQRKLFTSHLKSSSPPESSLICNWYTGLKIQRLFQHNFGTHPEQPLPKG